MVSNEQNELTGKIETDLEIESRMSGGGDGKEGRDRAEKDKRLVGMVNSTVIGE